jgi:hypothetical protein
VLGLCHARHHRIGTSDDGRLGKSVYDAPWFIVILFISISFGFVAVKETLFILDSPILFLSFTYTFSFPQLDNVNGRLYGSLLSIVVQTDPLN